MNAENGDKLVPPYGSWKTFMAFLDDCKQNGIPGRIDASILKRLSGTARNQLIAGLKSLALITGDGTPTDGLRLLVDAYKTEDWKPALAKTMSAAYAPILGTFDVAAATPGQLKERFRVGGGIEGETVDKAIRFYLSGLKEAGVPFSSRLQLRERFPRSGAMRRGSKARSATEAEYGDEEDDIEISPGMMRIGLDLLKMEGTLILAENITIGEWEKVNSWVKTLINLRTETKAED